MCYCAFVRILITGGCGFVGRHFIKSLDLEGHEILVIDNLIQGGGGLEPRDWFFSPSSRVSFLIQDVRKFFNESNEKFDLAIHLAAIVGGRLTIERNPLAVAEDLSIDAEFWKWAVRTRPNHIISFSSSAAYPISLQSSEGKRLRESDINFESDLGIPDLTYGWAKLTHEYQGLLAATKYGLKVATFRPFSGYGEDQDLSYPFTAICRRALEQVGRDEFEVWGSGKQSRDFLHIDDLVGAVLHSYSLLEDGTAVNLCSGHLTTFRELARLACLEAGYEPSIVGNSTYPEGVFSRVGDPGKLLGFGWSPEISLNEGVKSVISYQEYLMKRKGL